VVIQYYIMKIESRGQMIMVDERIILNWRLMTKIVLLIMFVYTIACLCDLTLTTFVCEPIGNHIEMNPISAYCMSIALVPFNLLIPLIIIYILAICLLPTRNLYVFMFFVCYCSIFIFSHLMGFLPFVFGMV